MNLATEPRPLSALSGFLLVNKPSGPTSFDLIRWLRRSYRDLKVGHAGTLDPLASGLMILLIGTATKRQEAFMKLGKTYLCGIRLGRRTDSGDTQGKVIDERPVPPLSVIDIIKAGALFIGDQLQTPPMFAAIKKDGVPLYRLARRGQTIERQPRPIHISALDVLSYDPAGLLTVRVRCSSGTYIRSLAEDLADKIGTIGCVESLLREEIGEHHLTDAFPGDQLKTIPLELLQSLLKEPPVS